jgi:hypothetical protein
MDSAIEKLPSHWDYLLCAMATHAIHHDSQGVAFLIFNPCSRHTALVTVGEVVAHVDFARCTRLHVDDTGGVDIESVTITENYSVTVTKIVCNHIRRTDWSRRQ